MATNALALSALAENLMLVNVWMSDDDHCSSTGRKRTTDLGILKATMIS